MQRVFISLLFSFSLITCLTTAPRAQTPSPSPKQEQSRGNPSVKVWVDTQYGFYHCPGSKFYGKTKQGVYMTQKQAQDRGYRPAYGVVCPTPPAPKAKSTKKSA